MTHPSLTIFQTLSSWLETLAFSDSLFTQFTEIPTDPLLLTLAVLHLHTLRLHTDPNTWLPHATLTTPTSLLLLAELKQFCTPKRQLRRRQWHPTPVLLPGKSHGQRSLVRCSPWGRKESDMTERFHFHALEKEMATHSSVLAWRIPGTGEAGGLLSMGSHRVGHDWSDLAAAAAA